LNEHAKMVRFLILADDFTGAMDTGVQFSKKGFRTWVTAERFPDFKYLFSKYDVLSMDLETRHLTKEEAYAVVYRTALAAYKAGVRHFYKKTDSALRGNIGAELSALLDASKMDVLHFAPAFPQNGRITKNGLQYVNGTLLENSVFAKDPFEPIKFSSVSDIIFQQSKTPVIQISADGNWGSTDVSPTPKIVVYDASTDADLDKIGGRVFKEDETCVLSGCAGFADALCRILPDQIKHPFCRSPEETVLLVAGSVNQITIDQMQYAKEIGYASFTLTPAQKYSSDFVQGGECERLAKQIADTIKKHKRVLIESVSERSQLNVADACQRDGFFIKKMRGLVCKNISELVVMVFKQVKLGSLAVFGGDSLYETMKRLGSKGIEPQMELSSGVVVSMSQVNDQPFCVISKSGGLGTLELAEQIDRFMAESRDANYFQ